MKNNINHKCTTQDDVFTRVAKFNRLNTAKDLKEIVLIFTILSTLI